MVMERGRFDVMGRFEMLFHEARSGEDIIARAKAGKSVGGKFFHLLQASYLILRYQFQFSRTTENYLRLTLLEYNISLIKPSTSHPSFHSPISNPMPCTQPPFSSLPNSPIPQSHPPLPQIPSNTFTQSP